MSRDPLGLPDRWLHCPKIGDIVGELFVPFKTPLDEKYSDKIPNPGLRWEPQDVVEMCKARNIQVGAIVDLTNSKRYYRPDYFERNEIIVRKIACRGHGETPDAESTESFVKFCSDYKKRFPHKKIGVHCTHGFNRTGFMICAFLNQEDGWDINAAIIVFSKSRNPGIYKQDYINDLVERYGDPDEADEVPEAAPKPDWDSEHAESGGSLSKSKQFMEGIPGVSLVDDPTETQKIQRLAADLCSYRRNGFPGAQPVSMDMKNVRNLEQCPHKVSWKADGTRYMMLIAGRDEIYFLDRDNAVFKVCGMTFPYRKNMEKEHLFNTLLDGEMVVDQAGGHSIPRYLIYDVAHFRTDKVAQMDFNIRMLCITKEIIEARRDAHQRGIIDCDSEPFRMRKKDFYDIDLTEKLLGEKFQEQVSHEIDGLIFQPIPEPYKAGRCDFILKWKPPHLNTIDFLLKIEKVQANEGELQKTKGCLYVGGHKGALAMLEKCNHEARKLDGKIVECKMGEKGGWVILRERTDKSFPNGYKTACGVWDSIRYPITKEYLLDIIRTKAAREQGQKRKADDAHFAVPTSSRVRPRR